MRTALLVTLFLGSCGGAPKQEPDPPVGSTGPTVVPTETRTQIQIRQDAACEQTGKRLRQCAVLDNQQQPPEERAKADVEHTAPILEREYIKACTAQAMSSRQVRVHEVCLREETECDPFLDCLDNAKPQ